MKRSEQINELVTALAKAQGEIVGAIKDRENPHFKSDYATLDSAWHACRAPLSRNGLSVIQSPMVMESGAVMITSVLAHNSGQWFENELTLMPRDASPQSVGSAITYGRRYSLMALVGIAPSDDDKDDDGNAAQNGSRGHVAPRGAVVAPKPPAPARKAEVKPTVPVEPGCETLESVGMEINELKKIMKISNAELAEWAKNKTGKDFLKDLDLAERISFRDELKADHFNGGK